MEVEKNSLLERIKHLVLDLDGTLYTGDALLCGSRAFLEILERLKLDFSFITNNSSRSRQSYLEKLTAMGVTLSPEQLLTPVRPTAQYLRREFEGIQRLYVLGTPGLCEEFQLLGFEVVGESSREDPHAVVVGFDRSLSYERLCRAAWWIQQGRPYVATHPDRICPTDLPTVLLDCGAICAALEAATARAPVAVLGKPHPAMLTPVLQRTGLQASSLAVVGDRLYTDMVLARRAGALAVLVLTGETKATDVDAGSIKALPPEQRPQLICSGLRELGEMLLVQQQQGNRG